MRIFVNHPFLLMLLIVAVSACQQPLSMLTVPATPIASPTATAATTSTAETALPTPYFIANEREPGERLLLSARVFDQKTGKPIPKATLFLRHTDEAGYYDEDAAGLPRLNGTLQTDQNGRVLVSTILPGYYADSAGGTRHIHATIEAKGYEPIERVILFDNDPNLTAAERNWELAIVAEMMSGEANEWQAKIEIELRP